MQMLGGQSVEWKRERQCHGLFPLPLPLGGCGVGTLEPLTTGDGAGTVVVPRACV